MKLITFSLWGKDPRYCIGAIKNAILSNTIYPDWNCRFYVADNVPGEYIKKLEEFNHVEVVLKEGNPDWTFSFNRFLPISEKGIDAIISRDTDSRLTSREKSAVDEWINSDKGFHIIKDHPYHYSHPILAGMFGCKNNIVDNIKNKISKYETTNGYHADQEFLRDIILPIVKDNYMMHDDFRGHFFPEGRKGLEFVGQIFNEDDYTIEEHVKALASALKGEINA